MTKIPMLLLDSDFIIAARFPQESTHKKAKTLIQKYFVGENIAYLDLVVFEVATVLSRKYSHQDAIEVIRELRARPECILKLTPENEQEAWKLFYSQTPKNTSFVDCANMVTAQNFGMRILSFDMFYKKAGG